ncbi:formate--phosphoribosylaminoimidazolecarboxamide ligase [Candidatus Micrarchaeota archaeon]|nr:formate--phosphoribosylaminoimidazolecarboxamide ligase [Candidatus Micrarchaeota archaeon]
MISKEEVKEILEGYNKNKLCIATLCSHSSLQIFKGAKEEGFKTLGIRVGEDVHVYDAFPLSKPDEFLHLEKFSDVDKLEEELREKNAILIPHGSLVEFVGEKIYDLAVPIMGNRQALLWESDRLKMAEWIEAAEMRMPRTLSPDNIDVPCIVKFPGAKGGKGYFTVKNTKEFDKKIAKLKISEEMLAGVLIQEYIVGVRFYPHYFYSPITSGGFRAGNGALEMLGIDRRIETNIEEIYRANSFGLNPEPSFAVVGNSEIILRESMLDKMLKIGKKTVEASEKLFGGIPGPFCVETICDEDFHFHVFEISARIVAGTNLYPQGSHYSCYIYKEPMSMARRIAREIKNAAKKNQLDKVIY